MRSQNKLFGREPVMILALLESMLALAVGFGLSISTEQFGLLMAASVAAIGVVTRSRVSPASDS